MSLHAIKLRSIYKNQAHVRSYVLEKAQAQGHGLLFMYQGETMTIPFDDLGQGFVTAKDVKSRIIPGQTFDLIAYKWAPDSETPPDNQQEFNFAKAPGPSSHKRPSKTQAQGLGILSDERGKNGPSSSHGR